MDLTEASSQIGLPPSALKKTNRLSRSQRTARGKVVRQWAPRPIHGPWHPAADRPDPIDLLEEQAGTRVSDLVPIRYGRMLVSPFTFYRGAASIMAADLASTPRTGLVVQCCGDAHLSNFGPVSYTHLRAHETDSYLVCRLLLEKKNKKNNKLNT